MEQLERFIESLGYDPNNSDDLYWLFTMGGNLDGIGDPEYEGRVKAFFSRRGDKCLRGLVDALFDGDPNAALYFLKDWKKEASMETKGSFWVREADLAPLRKKGAADYYEVFEAAPRKYVVLPVEPGGGVWQSKYPYFRRKREAQEWVNALNEIVDRRKEARESRDQYAYTDAKMEEYDVWVEVQKAADGWIELH